MPEATAWSCQHFPLPSTLLAKQDLSEGLQAQVPFSLQHPSIQGVTDVWFSECDSLHYGPIGSYF